MRPDRARRAAGQWGVARGDAVRGRQSQTRQRPRDRRTPEQATTGYWRLFVAAPLTEDARRVLGRLRAQVPSALAEAVRWVPPGGIHLTLRFLGDVDPARVPEIGERLATAAEQSGRLTLALGETGAFPDLQRPAVLWVGVTGEVDRLRQLHARVEGALSRAGFEPDRRGFEPHLTVGRLRKDTAWARARAVGAVFGNARIGGRPVSLPVESIVLFRSRLSQHGATYEALSTARLG